MACAVVPGDASNSNDFAASSPMVFVRVYPGTYLTHRCIVSFCHLVELNMYMSSFCSWFSLDVLSMEGCATYSGRVKHVPV
jgi:hypothetical protein